MGLAVVGPSLVGDDVVGGGMTELVGLAVLTKGELDGVGVGSFAVRLGVGSLVVSLLGVGALVVDGSFEGSLVCCLLLFVCRESKRREHVWDEKMYTIFNSIQKENSTRMKTNSR